MKGCTIGFNMGFNYIEAFCVQNICRFSILNILCLFLDFQTKYGTFEESFLWYTSVFQAYHIFIYLYVWWVWDELCCLWISKYKVLLVKMDAQWWRLQRPQRNVLKIQNVTLGTIREMPQLSKIAIWIWLKISCSAFKSCSLFKCGYGIFCWWSVNRRLF